MKFAWYHHRNTLVLTSSELPSAAANWLPLARPILPKQCILAAPASFPYTNARCTNDMALNYICATVLQGDATFALLDNKVYHMDPARLHTGEINCIAQSTFCVCLATGGADFTVCLSCSILFINWILLATWCTGNDLSWKEMHVFSFVRSLESYNS